MREAWSHVARGPAGGLGSRGGDVPGGVRAIVRGRGGAVRRALAAEKKMCAFARPDNGDRFGRTDEHRGVAFWGGSEDVALGKCVAPLGGGLNRPQEVPEYIWASDGRKSSAQVFRETEDPFCGGFPPRLPYKKAVSNEEGVGALIAPGVAL